MNVNIVCNYIVACQLVDIKNFHDPYEKGQEDRDWVGINVLRSMSQQRTTL